MTNDMIDFIASASAAGFTIIRDLTETAGGFSASAVVSGEPCRVSTYGTIGGIRWYVHIDSAGPTGGMAATALEARDEANSLIAAGTLAMLASLGA